jgi:putative endonuclease
VRRLVIHARGRASRYTRARLPVRLVYSEPAKNRSLAQKREAAIKQLSRVEKLALLQARRRQTRSQNR